MKQGYLVVLTTVLLCSLRSGAQVYCNVAVTKEKVSFGGCYSGALTINQLKVLDTSVREYPLQFKKVNAISLIEQRPLPNDSRKVVVFFNRRNSNFKWRVYPKIKGHNTDDVYSDFPHIDKAVLGDIFKANTWYLFNFYNPQFRVFVYCDSSRQVRFFKERLNANF